MCLMATMLDFGLFATTLLEKVDYSQSRRQLIIVGNKRISSSKINRAPACVAITAYYDDDTQLLEVESLSDLGTFEVQFYDVDEQLISFDYWDSSNGLYATLLSGDTCTIVLSSAESEYYIYL